MSFKYVCNHYTFGKFSNRIFSELPSLPSTACEKELKLFLKFIYSEKATKFCEISTLLLSYLVPVKLELAFEEDFSTL